jgi:hypothetical protein
MDLQDFCRKNCASAECHADIRAEMQLSAGKAGNREGMPGIWKK